jgi:hypothetical protein
MGLPGGTTLGYANYITVAMSGADFPSIQVALDSIMDAAADNPYMVWVAPGVYHEKVVMKPFVRLQGAGQGATIVTSAESSSVYPPDNGTIVMAPNSSLAELSVVSREAVAYAVAVLIPVNTTGVLIDRISAECVAGGTDCYGVSVLGPATSATLREVEASASGGTNRNIGLEARYGSSVVVRGGDFRSAGPGAAYAIAVEEVGTLAELRNVVANAENGSNSVGLVVLLGARAKVLQGEYIGIGGGTASGVWVRDTGSYAEIYQARLNASGATSFPIALDVRAQGNADVYGAWLRGSGGTNAYGANIWDAGSRLVASGSYIVGSGGSVESNGLYINAATNNAVVNSVVNGSNYTIHGSGGGTVTAVSSRFGQPVSLAGASCIACSRGNTFLATGCP